MNRRVALLRKNHGIGCNHVLRTGIREHMSAFGACPVFLVAGCSACRLYRGGMDKNVVRCRKNQLRGGLFLSAGLIRKAFSAIKACPVFDVACGKTCGLNGSSMAQPMILFSNNSISNGNLNRTQIIREQLPAHRALPVLRITRRRTCSCNRRHVNNAVSLCGNHGSRRIKRNGAGTVCKGFSASGACPVFEIARGGAGSPDRRDMKNIMCKSRNNCFGICYLIRAGLVGKELSANVADPVGRVARIRAGRRDRLSLYRRVALLGNHQIRSRYLMLSQSIREQLSAHRTRPVLNASVFRAGGRNRCMVHKLMCRRYHHAGAFGLCALISECLSAIQAQPVLHSAVHGTGGSRVLHVRKVM